MLKSIAAVLVLIAAVLWTPFWFQCVLLVLAVIFVRYRVLFLIPAIVSDVFYAPHSGLEVGTLKLTLIVAAMIVIWSVIIATTRIGHVVEA